MNEIKPGDLCVIAGGCCPQARQMAVDLECTVVGPAADGVTRCQFCSEETRDAFWCDVNHAEGILRAPIPRRWLRKVEPPKAVCHVFEDEDLRGLER